VIKNIIMIELNLSVNGIQRWGECLFRYSGRLTGNCFAGEKKNPVSGVA
jgi:hypothetical protein